MAMRFAAAGMPLELERDVEAAFDTAVRTHVRERPLADGVYSRLLAKQAPSSQPAVAVVVEPLWRMNDAFLGFAERAWSAAIMRALRAENIGFRLLDVRRLVAEGVSDVKLAPVIVLPARRIANVAEMKDASLGREIQRYLQAGGRVLWIGGSPPPAIVLPELAGAMQMSPANDKQWPVPLAELLESRVSWSGNTRNGWRFARSPVTRAGWQIPVAPYVFKASAPVEPVLQLETADGRQLIVGAAWPAGTPSAIFVPTYAIFPRLLSAVDQIDPASPDLDATGHEVLLGCLKRLGFP